MPTDEPLIGRMIRPELFLASAMIVVVAICWRGLSGPLIFDDLSNLAPLAGELQPDYKAFIFGNRSGSHGRSVSMVTFAINHWSSGRLDGFALKFTNLAIHLANAAILYYLLSMLLQTAYPSPRSTWLAAVVCVFWLLSPINVGVVFYAIQRMALLACFFVFLGLLFYVLWRRAQPATHAQAIYLFMCILCWPLAFFSKENGVMLPVLILIVECYFFSDARRFNALRAVIFLLIVSGCASVYLLDSLELLNYANRGFSLAERLSTQPLVVVQYIQNLLFPAVVDVGIFTDDFPIRHGAWNVGTLTSGIAIASIIAWCLLSSSNSRYRTVHAGILFFFFAHAVESTAIPLEMYYQHRNYLPSAGMYIAAVMLVNVASPRIAWRRTILILLVSTVTIWFGVISYQKSQAWATWPSLVINAYKHHPTSLRAGLEMAAMLSLSGQLAMALQANEFNASHNPERILQIKLQRFYLLCQNDVAIDESEYAAVVGRISPAASLETATAFENLLELKDRKECTNVDFDRLMQRISDMVDITLRDGSVTVSQMWHIEFYVIEYARLSGSIEAARSRLERSIKGGNSKAEIYAEEVLNAPGND